MGGNGVDFPGGRFTGEWRNESAPHAFCQPKRIMRSPEGDRHKALSLQRVPCGENNSSGFLPFLDHNVCSADGAAFALFAIRHNFRAG